MCILLQYNTREKKGDLGGLGRQGAPRFRSCQSIGQRSWVNAPLVRMSEQRLEECNFRDAKEKNSQSERDLQSWWQFQDSDSRCNCYVPAVPIMKAHKDRTLQYLYSSQNHPTTPSWIPSWGMIMIICGCIICVCVLGVLGEPISFRRALGQGSGTSWDGGGGGVCLSSDKGSFLVPRGSHGCGLLLFLGTSLLLHVVPMICLK